MSFQDAVRTVLTQKYVDFQGRARRSEYWYFFLFYVALAIVANIIDRAIGVQIVAGLLGVALLLPNLGVAIRRLHDTGHSGWWILIALTGIGILLLIFWYAKDSDPGPNTYGPSPKEGLVGSV